MGVESPNKQNIAIVEPSTAAADLQVQRHHQQFQLPVTVAENSVKRSLFGRVDHEEVMAFFQDQLAKMYADKMRKWNFDFVNERPMSGGGFDWEKVIPCDGSARHALAPANDKVTKFSMSRKSSSALITSHWAKCKKIDRRNTFTKSMSKSRKLIHNSAMERIK